MNNSNKAQIINLIQLKFTAVKYSINKLYIHTYIQRNIYIIVKTPPVLNQSVFMYYEVRCSGIFNTFITSLTVK